MTTPFSTLATTREEFDQFIGGDLEVGEGDQRGGDSAAIRR
jgi:hypothetical protein